MSCLLTMYLIWFLYPFHNHLCKMLCRHIILLPPVFMYMGKYDLLRSCCWFVHVLASVMGTVRIPLVERYMVPTPSPWMYQRASMSKLSRRTCFEWMSAWYDVFWLQQMGWNQNLGRCQMDWVGFTKETYQKPRRDTVLCQWVLCRNPWNPWSPWNPWNPWNPMDSM